MFSTTKVYRHDNRLTIINIDEGKVFETTRDFDLNMLHLNGNINSQSAINSLLIFVNNFIKRGLLPSLRVRKVFEAI